MQCVVQLGDGDAREWLPVDEALRRLRDERLLGDPGYEAEATRDALLVQACAEAVNAAGGPRAFFRACGEGRDGAVVATELVRCFQRFGLAITQDDAVRLVRSGGVRSGVDRLSLNEFTALVVDGSADLLAAATPPSTTTPWRAH
jgi:hypothetical protein